MKRNRLLVIILIPLIYLSSFSPRQQESKQNQGVDKLNVLPSVTRHIKRYYANKSAIDPKAMLVAGLERLEKNLDEVLVEFPDGENSASFRVQVMNEGKTFDMSGVNNLDALTEKIEEVFNFVKPRLVSKEPSTDEIEYVVTDEMLNTLDRHSGIITPQVYREFMIETEGSFGGLGIVIGIRDGQLTVIAPIEGTPAYDVGIRPNDRIVQIEYESTVNMSLIEAVGKLRGPKGTVVNIYVMRDGFPEPKKFSITRDTIKIESVEAYSIGDGIGYIRIRDFQRNTLDSIRANLKSLKKNGNLKGIILDLRGNPGGLLDQAERISNLFLKNGVIVTTKSGDSKKPYRATPEDFEYSGKVVILVDSGSASASEIVAGALKNNERAVVLGETTFGKGSVQQIFDLNDGAALKLTIAQYLTPGDISIQDTGITPDIQISPVIVSKDAYTLSLETQLKEELNGEKNAKIENKEKPIYTIFYLETPKDSQKENEETPEEALSREEKLKKIGSDFSVAVAKDILLQSTSLSRKEILNQVQNDMTDISKNEENKIVEKWQTVGVDWSLGSKVSGAPAVSLKIVPTPLIAQAGEKLSVQAEVENTGKIPLYRLKAVIESDNPIFNGKEFIFGKLNPGEKRESSLTFEIPKGILKREDIITLNFSDAYKTALPQSTVKAQIGELPRPVFAYNYEIIDDGRSGSSGNGNGILEAGETVGLLVKVKNTGNGLSEKGIITLKNLSGDSVFLKKGRYEFKDLHPGEIKDATFTFTVNKPIPEIEMELGILDEVYREELRDKISITRKNREVEKQDVFKEPPSISIFNPPLSTASEEVALKGTVKDKDGLEVVSVFVGDDKLMLLPSSYEEIPLSLNLKLNKGSNVITILAKDKKGLTSKESVVVRFGE
ncbi:MAG: S41 family peptidase [Candidatus Dadabacteria bacterium]|nr:S41 family peptidase [Candidatus Dadabacteria bacterium]